MLSRENKLPSIVLLLIAIGAANASPTVTTDNVVVPDVQIAPDVPIVAASDIEVVEPVDSRLAEIGRELRTPPVLSMDISAAASVVTTGRFPSVESLPAVPGALLMALTGFLCVSLVKDRRAWLAALCGLLWVSQTGIQVLPQLAVRLSHANHSKQLHGTKPACFVFTANSSRLRSDIEGSQYIGLLHYLNGIPDAAGSASLAELITLSQHRQRPFGETFIRPHNTYSSPLAILPEQYRLNLSLKCPASIAGQSIVFSPEFIFSSLARGPPQSASMNFHTVGV